MSGLDVFSAATGMLVFAIPTIIVVLLNQKKSVQNTGIMNENKFDKVFTVNADELAAESKLFMCRCWKSKNYPYCDGSHNAHNKLTGDLVGPLIIEKK